MTQRRQPSSDRRPVVITGGCGFIGCNIADALLQRGERVVAFDAMMRNGARENAIWLKSRHADALEVRVADVRDAEAVGKAVQGAKAVLHLAAQVAVTTSIESPRDDFAINALGTLNVLEGLRETNPSAPLLFASTNKVYGKLFGNEAVERHGDRYRPRGEDASYGISEAAPLDFYSPYGCSKGAADQYVRDYARIYGLRTAVLRMSCIYGPRQFGTEDQGWIAHFVLQALHHAPLTIYGDGCQVRDALHVSDAAQAWISVLDNIERTRGGVFNLGGGAENSLSLRELLGSLEDLGHTLPPVRYADWRPGDQPWYVSNLSRLKAATGWAPRVPLADGLRSLDGWLRSRFLQPSLAMAESR